MIAIEIDEGIKENFSDLPVNIQREFPKSKACCCGKEFDPEYWGKIMYVNFDKGKLRWWHLGSVNGMCINKKNMGLLNFKKPIANKDKASTEQKIRNVQKHIRIANSIAGKFPNDPRHESEYKVHITKAEKLIKTYGFKPLEPIKKQYA